MPWQADTAYCLYVCVFVCVCLCSQTSTLPLVRECERECACVFVGGVHRRKVQANPVIFWSNGSRSERLRTQQASRKEEGKGKERKGERWVWEWDALQEILLARSSPFLGSSSPSAPRSPSLQVMFPCQSTQLSLCLYYCCCEEMSSVTNGIYFSPFEV
ncbi:unnamed protein product [Boreogadus saida]